jgi:hypothetical protein
MSVGFLGFFTLYFWPAEFGKLMASGDALFETLPAFLGAHNLWEPTMFLGYPLYADPNQQYWYPPALLHLVTHAYNAFAVAPFVLAAFGTAGFVRSLTRSSAAGVAAGLVYALGGFMISHAGHLMLVHPAAWTPFVMWAVESMRRRRDAVAMVAAAVALGLCGVAGQPQVFVFTATLAVAYVLASARGAQIGPRTYLLRAAAFLALGTAFAGIQLIPEALLALESARGSLRFGFFTALQVPATQLALRAVFPYALGPALLPWYAFSKADFAAFPEETIAVGLVSLALAFVALCSVAGDRRIFFWTAVACGALLLAVGDATPLASFTYNLPLYGLFRAPGRHAFEWSFAVAVLAGYGCAAIARRRAPARWIAGAAAFVICLVAVAYVQLTAGQPSPLQHLAQFYGVNAGQIASPLTNGALGVPLATAALGLGFVSAATRFAGTRAAGVLLVLAVALDTGSFGWSAYWNWGAVGEQSLTPPPWIRSLGARARAGSTRLAWLPGRAGGIQLPNLSTLWGIPSVDGYTPLVPHRTADLLGVTGSGGVKFSSDPDDRSLDLAGASPLATLVEPVLHVTAEQPFAPGDVHVFLTSHGDEARRRAIFGLPTPLPATRVALVSELGNATVVPQGAEVAELDVVYVTGARERHAIVAGRDTSEFAYDRADVRPYVRHRRVPIYDGDATTHRYVGSFVVSAYVPIARVEIDWRYPPSSSAAITIGKISLVDGRRHTAAAYGDLASIYAAPQHWRPIAVAPAVVAFENEEAFPRAWFARPVSVDAAQALRAVRHGLLPGDLPFDPLRDAAVEGAVAGVNAPAGGDRVLVEDDRPTGLTLASTCAQTCFLVVRDGFDSYWRVRIDDRPANFFAVDVALAGLAVPAGTHRVRFDFAPMSLLLGMISTGIATVASGLLLWRDAYGASATSRRLRLKTRPKRSRR